MRNYVFSRAVQYEVHYFDEFHVEQGSGPMYALGRNDVDLGSEISIQNNLFTSSLPSNWTAEFSFPRQTMTMYFTLDKTSLMVILKAFAPQFISDAIANQPPFYPMLINPKETPRKTGWVDPEGVKRKPPPSEDGKEVDFSGAAGLIEALQGFLKLASDLTVLKEVRKAGIVLYAYSQVLKNAWSITEAIQYLIDNRITATV